MDTQTRKQAEHGIYLPATVQYAKDMADNAMVNNEQGDELWFSIRNMDEEPVGYAVIDWINEKMGNAQLSITVYRQYRGLGYAGSATSILLEYLLMRGGSIKSDVTLWKIMKRARRLWKVWDLPLTHSEAGCFIPGDIIQENCTIHSLILNITAQARTKKEKERTIKALKYLIPHWEIQKNILPKARWYGSKDLITGNMTE